MTTLLRLALACLSSLLISISLASCATASSEQGESLQKRVDHGFTFDVRNDSPGHYLLDYRYGNSTNPVTAPADWVKASGRMFQYGNTYGAIPVGKDLYVKWRVDATNQIYEKTVDLTHRLPKDMTGFQIKFVLKGDMVFVYAISPERAPPNWPRYDPSPRWTEYKVFSVYPTNNVNLLK